MIAIFCFYDKATGKQTLYTTHGIRHCNVTIFDGRDYVFAELQPHGFKVRRLRATDTVTLINNLKKIKSIVHIITVQIDKPYKTKWFYLWMRTCNELCRYMTGINVGFTFNPYHLIKKLVKYNNMRNYEILDFWSRHERQ